ncbi:MAG: methionine--tRNA ligase subunit beta, partial [Flavobacteriales bacterium]
VNSELVAILGNFVNRVMVLTHKFYEGKVPAAGFGSSENAAQVKEYTEKCREDMIRSMESCKKNMEAFKFRDALADMMNIARIGNKYLADTEPWKKIKTDADVTAGIMNFGIQTTALLSLVCEPFLPNTAENIRKQLNLPIEKLVGFWNKQEFSEIIHAGHTIGEATLLFKNIEDTEVENQVEKLRKNKELNTPVLNGNPLKPMITYDEFTKMDIRVGEILEAEKVEGADKLLKLKVDTGIDQRIVVSGIAPFYKPEEIIGQKVSVLMNLAPRKIRGVESHGMILMAEDKEGKLTFVQPKADGFENGSEIK